MQCTPPLSIEQRSDNRFLVNADFFKVGPTLGPQSLDSLKEYLCCLSGLLPVIAIQMATNSSGEGGAARLVFHRKYSLDKSIGMPRWRQLPFQLRNHRLSQIMCRRYPLTAIFPFCRKSKRFVLKRYQSAANRLSTRPAPRIPVCHRLYPDVALHVSPYTGCPSEVGADRPS